MIHIAFLTNAMYTSGGIGRVVSTLANQLSSNHDYKITIVNYCKKDDKPYYVVNDSIQMLYLNNKPTSMFKYCVTLGFLKLNKMLKDQKIDIVFACGDILFLLGSLSCMTGRCKCICWEHTSGITTTDNKFEKISRIIGSKISDGVLTITKECKQIYLDKYKPQKVYQIYNPIDLSIENLTHTYNSKSQLIITVGRLSYQKNYPLLIKVAEQVLTIFEGWEWHIWGEGKDRSTIEDLIEKTSVRNRIKLKGTSLDIFSEYPKYAFFVSTSRYEGFGMAILEAMCCKLPVVSFDIPCGPKEIIMNNINGYLIPPFNIEQMVSCISTLCSSESVRQSFSDKSKIHVDKFSLETIICNWNKMINEILNGK